MAVGVRTWALPAESRPRALIASFEQLYAQGVGLTADR